MPRNTVTERVQAMLRSMPEYVEDRNRRILRRIRVQQRAAACKLRVEEYFADQMGMSVQQWQRAQWNAARGSR